MEHSPKIAGEQLRLVRLSYGYSLEDVAERVGVTRQFIQQLETGARAPSEDLAAALADELGVSRAFLADPIPSTVRPEQCHFRSMANRPVSVTSQVLARGTLLDKFISTLENHVKLPIVDFPEFSVASSNDVELAAEYCRRYWGLGLDGPITSMMRVVENAGAVVTYFSDLSERVDAFSMDRRRPVIVRSSLKDSLFRQRFDIAHECGHLVMHRGIQTGDKLTEGQAHRFASAFLFPREAVLREFPRGNSINWRKLLELKIRWKISLRALIRRGYDLNILSSAQYRSANIYLVKNGYSKVEKYDDDPLFPVESPELLKSAINAMQNGIYGGALRIANEAGFGIALLNLLSGMELKTNEIPDNVFLFK